MNTIESENYCKDCGEAVYIDENELGHSCDHCGSARLGGPDFDIPPQLVKPVIDLLEDIIELDKQAVERKNSQ